MIGANLTGRLSNTQVAEAERTADRMRTDPEAGSSTMTEPAEAQRPADEQMLSEQTGATKTTIAKNLQKLLEAAGDSKLALESGSGHLIDHPYRESGPCGAMMGSCPFLCCWAEEMNLFRGDDQESGIDGAKGGCVEQKQPASVKLAINKNTMEVNPL